MDEEARVKCSVSDAAHQKTTEEQPSPRRNGSKTRYGPKKEAEQRDGGRRLRSVGGSAYRDGLRVGTDLSQAQRKRKRRERLSSRQLWMDAVD